MSYVESPMSGWGGGREDLWKPFENAASALRQNRGTDDKKSLVEGGQHPQPGHERIYLLLQRN